jgi:hypothetical protein
VIQLKPNGFPSQILILSSNSNYSRGSRHKSLTRLSKLSPPLLTSCSPPAQVGSLTAQLKAASAQVQRRKWKINMSTFRCGKPCSTTGNVHTSQPYVSREQRLCSVSFEITFLYVSSPREIT